MTYWNGTGISLSLQTAGARIMSNRDDNAFPELFELLMRTAAVPKSQDYEVKAEVRINSTIIEGPEGFCFSIGLKCAWLDMDLSGMTSVPGSRLNEPKVS